MPLSSTSESVAPESFSQVSLRISTPKSSRRPSSARSSSVPSKASSVRSGGCERAGLELACVTNWDIGIGEQLEKAGLAPFLSTVVSSAETGAEKPDPRVFAEALSRLGVQAGPRGTHRGR